MSRSAYRPSARYSQQLQYLRTSLCCSGYAGTPPNCERKVYLSIMDISYIQFVLHTTAICSVCYNGGTCAAPENCSCTTGWTGSNCSIGMAVTWFTLCSQSL